MKNAWLVTYEQWLPPTIKQFWFFCPKLPQIKKKNYDPKLYQSSLHTETFIHPNL